MGKSFLFIRSDNTQGKKTGHILGKVVKGCREKEAIVAFEIYSPRIGDKLLRIFWCVLHAFEMALIPGDPMNE